MQPNDVIGQWFHEAAPPMLRIQAVFTFTADGGATLDERYTMPRGERVPIERMKNSAGRWSIKSDRLVVELPERRGSPFELWLVASGDLQWHTGGVWRRRRNDNPPLERTAAAV